MALDWGAPPIVFVVAWASTLFFSLLVLVLRWSHAPSRAMGFAFAPLSLAGVLIGLGNMWPDAPGLLARTVYVLLIPTPLLFVFFWCHWPRPWGPARTRAGRMALLAPIVPLVALYVAAPDLWPSTRGPLAALVFLTGTVVSFGFVRSFLREPAGPVRESLFLMSVGLLVAALIDGVWWTLTSFTRPVEASTFSVWVMGVLIVYLTVVMLVLYARHAGRDDARGWRTRVLALFGGIAVVGGLAASWAFHVVSVERGVDVFLVADAVVCAGGLGVLIFGAVRYQMLDVDVKVKWTVRQGTVASAFVAVFFLVSEGAQAAFEGWSGSPFLGVGAAALLVFAIAPMQRLGTRVSETMLPGVKPLATMDRSERAALFLDQARFAWMDGQLSAKDRQILDVARTRLGLSHEDAARLERQAMPPGA